MSRGGPWLLRHGMWAKFPLPAAAPKMAEPLCTSPWKERWGISKDHSKLSLLEVSREGGETEIGRMVPLQCPLGQSSGGNSQCPHSPTHIPTEVCVGSKPLGE